MKLAPVYVEVEINAPLETVWERTFQPDLHTRWDLRFSQLEYLPRASEAESQRLLYTTRIGFGLKLRGEGAFIGTKDAVDGSRTTALHFWCSDRRSLVRSGTGYWRYIPSERGTTFLTRYDYETRFGRVGAVLDRLVLRPLLCWATAWSFDRLRLWIEQGVSPEVARRRLLPRAGRCRRKVALRGTAEAPNPSAASVELSSRGDVPPRDSRILRRVRPRRRRAAGSPAPSTSRG